MERVRENDIVLIATGMLIYELKETDRLLAEASCSCITNGLRAKSVFVANKAIVNMIAATCKAQT